MPILLRSRLAPMTATTRGSKNGREIGGGLQVRRGEFGFTSALTAQTAPRVIFGEPAEERAAAAGKTRIAPEILPQGSEVSGLFREASLERSLP